jgi:dihydroxyacetone kinase
LVFFDRGIFLNLDFRVTVNNYRLSLNPGEEVCVLLNNLGAISDLEMGILVNEAINQVSVIFDTNFLHLTI